MKQLLPSLDYWKRYEESSDNGQFEAFKEQLIKEINDLHIEGLTESGETERPCGQLCKSGISAA